MKCKALGRFTTLDEQICKLRRVLRMRGDDPKAVEIMGASAVLSGIRDSLFADKLSLRNFS